MRIVLVNQQSSSDIEANIKGHIRMIEQHTYADIICFPELSIPGYFPSLAHSNALSENTPEFEQFELLSKKHDVLVVVSFSLATSTLPAIAQQFFFPDGSRFVHQKSLLHEEELPYFSTSGKLEHMHYKGMRIMPVICFEAAQQEAMAFAQQEEVDIYLASVAKDAEDMSRLRNTLSVMKDQHVLVSNAIGNAEDFICSGGSFAQSPNAMIDESSPEVVQVVIPSAHD